MIRARRRHFEHIEALRWVENDRRAMAQAALKFTLAHPAVSIVIPGMRSTGHVNENIAVSDQVEMTPEEVERLHTRARVHGFKYPWATDRGDAVTRGHGDSTQPSTLPPYWDRTLPSLPRRNMTARWAGTVTLSALPVALSVNEISLSASVSETSE
jgi:hypothetical protein